MFCGLFVFWQQHWVNERACEFKCSCRAKGVSCFLNETHKTIFSCWCNLSGHVTLPTFCTAFQHWGRFLFEGNGSLYSLGRENGCSWRNECPRVYNSGGCRSCFRLLESAEWTYWIWCLICCQHRWRNDSFRHTSVARACLPHLLVSPAVSWMSWLYKFQSHPDVGCKLIHVYIYEVPWRIPVSNSLSASMSCFHFTDN